MIMNSIEGEKKRKRESSTKSCIADNCNKIKEHKRTVYYELNDITQQKKKHF